MIVEITGYRVGARKVQADKLLAQQLGTGLAAGKALVDSVLAGRPATFRVDDEQQAAQIIAALDEMGFDARLRK